MKLILEIDKEIYDLGESRYFLTGGRSANRARKPVNPGRESRQPGNSSLGRGHRGRIERRIQQDRPFSSVAKFIHNSPRSTCRSLDTSKQGRP